MQLKAKEKIEDGFLIKEYDIPYDQMPEGFEMDIDAYITCHPSKRESFASTMPVKIYCAGILVYTD